MTVGRNVEYLSKVQLVKGTLSLPSVFHCPEEVIALTKANVLKKIHTHTNTHTYSPFSSRRHLKIVGHKSQMNNPITMWE